MIFVHLKGGVSGATFPRSLSPLDAG